MAVAPTGAIYKALEFDGVSSRTYGVYITGTAVYNAPERDVEMIAIPGRNGSFALDKGRFENIEVSYPAGIFADAESDFAEAVSDFRNFLCSRNGYVRLQDEYNPNEYRMAVYKSGLEVTPAQLKVGEFNIVFECKPQRWLTSGESAVTVGEWSEWETESGPIVEIEASETDKIKSLSVALEPIQEGSGTPLPDNVRPISGRTECVTERTGKNLLNMVDVLPDGSYNGNIFTCSSLSNRPTVVLFDSPQTITFSYTKGEFTGSGARLEFLNGSSVLTSKGMVSATPTSQTVQNVTSIRFNYGSGGTLTITEPQIELGSTATAYEPYSDTSYTTDLGRTVYGGTLEQVGGTLTDTMGYIASYNGETIGEPWLSDRDEYVEGTTPSIGAEVVYTLATPQTYQLTPTEVALIKGQNNVWSDGDVTLEYGQDPNVIVNPTLFEASPLLIAEGTGKITVNGTDIRIQNSVVGDCGLCYDLNVPGNYYLAGFTNIYIATGDIIETESINYAFAIYNADSSYTFTSQSITNVTGNPDVLPDATDLPGGEAVVVTCRLDDEAYSFRTALSKTIGFDVNITNSNGDSATIHVEVTAAYDGNKIIEYSAFVGYVPEAFYLYNPMFQFTAAPSITIHSTAATFGNPTYIDCDIGEAYADLGGTISPLNRYIELGSKLPTLAIGNTEITFDNTIATLKVVPRWWKI